MADNYFGSVLTGSLLVHTGSVESEKPISNPALDKRKKS